MPQKNKKEPECEIVLTDHPAAAARRDHYLDIVVDAQAVIASWRDSLFSFEWLTPDGAIKSPADLPPAERAKREEIEKKITAGLPLQKPILGIGLQDNVEIGSGRAEFLTLAARGMTAIPVHIPKGNKNDFTGFEAALPSQE